MTIKINGTIKPINDHILATHMNFGEQKSQSGIVLRSDNGKSEGVRPRWAKVYAVGPEQKEVSADDWILVEHGRWTRSIEVQMDDTETTLEIFRIDPTGILLVADEKPSDLELGMYASPTHGATFNF